ncbi:hypothetical protein EVAR_40417_1 [Eumeta japonica]|uniref:Uncharacterized protein n=1 Tax=Eumeta variegata TaxID=151549 RepID=A0A4C1WAC0_EUMVA|nr:hypothetical protein EVAR_40417_1 [Eumeta japonica]
MLSKIPLYRSLAFCWGKICDSQSEQTKKSGTPSRSASELTRCPGGAAPCVVGVDANYETWLLREADTFAQPESLTSLGGPGADWRGGRGAAGRGRLVCRIRPTIITPTEFYDGSGFLSRVRHIGGLVRARRPAGWKRNRRRLGLRV